MRVLFTTTAGLGHIHPLIPLARALAAAGHTVAFAGASSRAATVAACGFPLFAAGYDPVAPPDGDVQAAQASLAPFRVDFSTGLDAGRALMAQYWAALCAGVLPRRMVPDLLTIADRWQPDLIVRELYETGGAVVAEVIGVPQVVVQVGQIIDLEPLRAATSQGLDPLRADYGLPPDPAAGWLAGAAFLSFVPPSYQEPGFRHANHWSFQPTFFDRSGPEELPAWLTPDLPRPMIYLTFGTVPHLSPYPDLYHTAITGLRELAGTLIVTVGRDRDPAVLGPLPAHVRVERYIPQSALLPRCDLVVHHGGHSTTLASLAAGLPQVVLPLGADQPANALRVIALQLGEVRWAAQRQPADIAGAARLALDQPCYRANAVRIQAEMAALPPVEAAVTLLEGITRTQAATTRRPAPAPVEQTARTLHAGASHTDGLAFDGPRPNR